MPGTPLSDPRARVRRSRCPNRATSSRTIAVTSTSPGSASATQPRRDRHAEPGDIVAAGLDLARRARRRGCGCRGAASRSRARERARNARAGVSKTASTPSPVDFTHRPCHCSTAPARSVVPVEQRTPARRPCRVQVGRADDVGEQRRRQRALPVPDRSRRRGRELRDERLDRVEHLVGVDPGDVIDAGDLDEPRGRDVLGEESAVLDRDLPIVRLGARRASARGSAGSTARTSICEFISMSARTAPGLAAARAASLPPLGHRRRRPFGHICGSSTRSPTRTAIAAACSSRSSSVGAHG